MDQIEDVFHTAYFTCRATGNPIPTISWYFNSAPVTNDTNVDKYTISMMSLNTTTINSRLTIYYLLSSDVGTYTCSATNVVSTVTSSGVLTVEGQSSAIHYNCLFH